MSAEIQKKIAKARREVEELARRVEQMTLAPMNHALQMRSEKSSYVPKKPADRTSLYKMRRRLKGHFNKIYALAWAPDARGLATASQDGTIIIWNAFLTSKRFAITPESSWQMACAYGADNRKGTHYVCHGGLDNVVSIYKLPDDISATCDSIPDVKLSGHTGYISCIDFMHEPGRMLTSSGDCTCVLWDFERSVALRTFDDHKGDVMSVQVSPKSDHIFVSGGTDMHVNIWDIRQNHSHAAISFAGHETDVNCVAFFPDGQSVGSGSDDSTCRLFDIRAARQIQKYEDDNILSGVTSIDFTKNGGRMIATYEDNDIFVWNTTGQQNMSWNQSVLSGHDRRVSCVKVSPDGKAIASGSWDCTACIWA